jgi:Leucine-rich repeat (LRR) protein
MTLQLHLYGNIHNGCLIPSDLGTSLNNVTILWLSRCGLTELDGMSLGFSAVTELYLSFNSIKDLSPLGDLPKLQILDLEG